jgi:SynChlorMet cassette radical SAM/SPASM protein ScmF
LFGPYDRELEVIMDYYRKNLEYSYHHVEEETGYSLLYSRSRDRCLILNPFATALWRGSGDVFEADQTIAEFAAVFDTGSAAEYMRGIIEKMFQAGVLDKHNDQEQVPKSATRKATDTCSLNTINLYITNECNSRCYHCYQPTSTAVRKSRDAIPVIAPDHISHHALLAFLEQALPLGLKEVKITGGEPLLRNDVEDIIRGARALGLKISIESNGYFLTKDLAELLAQEAKLIAISLDGGSAAVHDRLRGCPGSFDLAIQAMQMLSSKGANVQAIMSVSRLNMPEIEPAIIRAAASGCKSFKINIIVTLGRAERLQDSGVLLDMRQMLDVSKTTPIWESRHNIEVFFDGPPCFASLRDAFKNGVGACCFTNLLGVLPDGGLSYCGIGNSHPELVFGNILDDDFSLAHFWQVAAPLNSARRILADKLDGICTHCVLESSCKGSCRAFAYSYSGSLQDAHPWCQKAFQEGLFPSHLLIPGSALTCGVPTSKPI